MLVKLSSRVNFNKPLTKIENAPDARSFEQQVSPTKLRSILPVLLTGGRCSEVIYVVKV